MAEVKTKEFVPASRRAVDNPQLQAALKRAGGGFDSARMEAIEELGEERWQELRERARRIKEHTLENLDYYLELLYNRVTANGGQVHFAADAQEANEIISELALSRGAKTVTKSKSMVSEEMGLNHSLEALGIRSVETDLGEYIIQLAGETPFHIVGPAIHKTKEDVSELFADKIDRPGLVEIEDLAETAREVLRNDLLQADMGISGANFLVAETGTLVIVTNEGNGRFCTSSPRIHVALTGMEKVVPSLEDLAVFLRLLPRAATGQRLTSYVSMVSGPRAPMEEDGPEEFHLVIVNNGRSRLLQDEKLRGALSCIRCGACLNICPVYRKVGGHAYGWVYPGPIGAVIDPVLVGLDKAKDLPFASSLCGACREVCPVKINLPHMLLTLRSRLMEGDEEGGSKATLMDSAMGRGYRTLMSSPAMMSLARKVGRVTQVAVARKGWIRKIPLPPFDRWTRARDMRAIPKESFRDIWDKELSKENAQPSQKGRKGEKP